MKKNKHLLIIALMLAAVFIVGGLLAQFDRNPVDHSQWSDAFQKVSIASSVDEHLQDAYFLAASAQAPLLLSLHTWSGDFSQPDPMADLALEYGWNYIHPNFRASTHPVDACLSPLVIANIDDAIEYAVDNAHVDLDNIFIVGVSGGGYVALGSYLKTRHRIKAFLSWAPITDLSAWYQQSLSLSNEPYAADILACTSNGSQSLNVDAARKRSPLYWDVPPETKSTLEIYAGINDGHARGGSVPISHSLLFFNRLMLELGLNDSLIDQPTINALLNRNMKIDQNLQKIGDRGVIYKNITPKVSLTIFDGRHEILPKYTFQRLIELTKTNRTGPALQ